MFMKMKYKSLVAAGLAALSTLTLQAQSTTVLEGFEEFVDLVPGQYVWSPSTNAYVELWTMWGGRGGIRPGHRWRLYGHQSG